MRCLGLDVVDSVFKIAPCGAISETGEVKWDLFEPLPDLVAADGFDDVDENVQQSSKVCEFQFSFAGGEWAGDVLTNVKSGLTMSYKGLEIELEPNGEGFSAELTKEQCDVLGIDPTEDYAGYWDENNTYTMDVVFQVEETND